MEIEQRVASVAAIGALIGLAQLLTSDDRLTWRRAVGRSLATSGLAVSAFSILAVFPDAPIELIVGVACAMASLGIDALRACVEKYWNSKHGSK